MSLVSTFLSTVLPVVAIAAAGFALGRSQTIDPGPLNTIVVYVLAPALVFHSLATTELSGGLAARVIAGVAIYVLVMAALAEGLARLVGIGEPYRSVLVLVAVFLNSGNFGIPLSSFAFGEVGRATAVLYLAGQSALAFTVGVYLATRSSGTSGLGGVRRVLTVPLIYAVILAGLARWAGVVPPAGGTAMTTVKLVGDSAIPVMLLILGIFLARASPRESLKQVAGAAGLKLLVAPVVAIGAVLALGITEPTVARTVILESSTPAAVMPLILLVEFGDRRGADFVTTAILVTTLLSVVTLTVLIAWLESGAVV